MKIPLFLCWLCLGIAMLVFAMFTSAMLGIVQVGSWLGGWVSGWVDEWVSGWVGEWVSGWVDEWVDEWVGLLLRQDILMCAKIIDLLFCLHNTRRWRLEHMGSIPENQCSTWWVCVHVCGGGGEFYMVSVCTCVWGRGRVLHGECVYMCVGEGGEHEGCMCEER